MSNPVIHFEMGYFDRERMKKFYETAFDWKLQQMGAEMGNYVLAQTAETDEKGMIKTPGTIEGTEKVPLGLAKKKVVEHLVFRYLFCILKDANPATKNHTERIFGLI